VGAGPSVGQRTTVSSARRVPYTRYARALVKK
jgi:hypothetical protein